MAKVFIVPGHGGHDGGAPNITYKFLDEKTLNLQVALACGVELNKHGVMVEYSRSTDVYVGLEAQASLAVESGADIAVSFHFNSGGGSGSIGFYKASDTKYSKALAWWGVEYMVNQCGFKRRDISIIPHTQDGYSDRMGWLKYMTSKSSTMPAVLFETCFLDNVSEVEKCNTIEEINNIGVQYANAILNYFNEFSIPYDSSIPIQPPKPLDSYLVRVNSPNGKLNCYFDTSINSSILKVYTNNEVLTISQEKNSWGYTGEGWVLLEYTKPISSTEVIFQYFEENSKAIKYNEDTGLMEYPIDENPSADTPQDQLVGKYLISDLQLLKYLKIREKEPELTKISTEKVLVTVIQTAKQNINNMEEYGLKLKLALKTEVQINKVLEPSKSHNILIKTASNAFTEIDEELILKKIEEDKQSIINYFKETYDDEGWNKNIKEAPQNLNFWFDFMETDGELGKYAVQVIGNRPKAINDDKVTAIYYQETPSVIFLSREEYENNLDSYSDKTGYTFVKLQPFMENYFTISGQGKSAKDELDSLLYNHSCATESTTLTSVPVYHLQPNTRVFINDNNTNTQGEYIVNKITVPLQYNGTSSITATKAVERIY